MTDMPFSIPGICERACCLQCLHGDKAEPDVNHRHLSGFIAICPVLLDQTLAVFDELKDPRSKKHVEITQTGTTSRDLRNSGKFPIAPLALVLSSPIRHSHQSQSDLFDVTTAGRMMIENPLRKAGQHRKCDITS